MLSRHIWWLMGILFVLAAGMFIFDLLPLWQERQALQMLIVQREKLFEQKKQQQLPDVKQSVKKEDGMSQLYQLIESAGVHIKQQGQAKKQNRSDGEVVHIVGQAAVGSSLKMIETLNHSSSFVLLDFTLRILSSNAEWLVFEGDILLLGQPRQVKTFPVFKEMRPFCLNQQDYPNRSAMISSVEGMQMMAYLRQGNQVRAIVRLADGQLITIEKHQQVGGEQAVVVDISDQGVLLQLPHGLKLFK